MTHAGEADRARRHRRPSRSRLTVFFRLLLAIPHFIWFALWSVAVIVAAIIGWIAALATGRLPEGLHRFFCSYLRYATHLYAYVSLTADPYPPFNGEHGVYPLDLGFPEPEPHSRLRKLLRPSSRSRRSPREHAHGCMLRGSQTEALRRDRGAGPARRAARRRGVPRLVRHHSSRAACRAGCATPARTRSATGAGLAYLLLVTERYPDADPSAMLAGLSRLPEHPVRVVATRSIFAARAMTVLLPAAARDPAPRLARRCGRSPPSVAAILHWFVTLFSGRPAAPLPPFLSRYVRYGFHVSAFAFIAANPFPGSRASPAPTRSTSSCRSPAPEPLEDRLPRVLYLPAAIVSSALGAALSSRRC